MATSTIQNDIHEIKVMYVEGKFNDGSSYKYLWGTTPPGYKFLCWLQGMSSGWVGLVYPDSPQNQNCAFWRESTSGEAAFTGVYLVYR